MNEHLDFRVYFINGIIREVTKATCNDSSDCYNFFQDDGKRWSFPKHSVLYVESML